MKIIKHMLFAGLFLLMSAHTVLAAQPVTQKAAEEIAASYVPAQCELLKSEQENNNFVFRFYNKNKQEWYKIALEKEKGKIVTFDSCKTLNKGSATVVLTPEEAQNVVWEENSEADIVTCDLTEKGGVYKYEITFTSDKFYGKFIIHPESGTILEREFFMGKTVLSVSESRVESAGEEPTASAVYIGTEKAKKAALNKVPGAEEISCELAYEDGRAVYKGNLKKGCFKYDYTVDALTGTMMKWDMESSNQ